MDGLGTEGANQTHKCYCCMGYYFTTYFKSEPWHGQVRKIRRTSQTAQTVTMSAM